MTTFPKITIDVDAAGVGKVLVDGHDISGTVGAVNVRIRPNNLSTVYLKMVGDLEITTNGIATVCPIDGRTRHRKAEEDAA